MRAARPEALDEKLSGPIEALDQKFDEKLGTQFRCLVGIQVGFFLTIMGALTGGFFALR